MGAVRRRGAWLVLAAGLTAAGCGGGGPDPIVLDGSPRVPDDEGLVTAVAIDSLTLDGERTYDVSDELRSFSTLDLATAPLLFSDGQYVQVGLDGDTVVWLGSLARPVGVDPPVVYVTDSVAAVDDGDGDGPTVTFAGGTVLRLAPGVEPPAVGAPVRAEVDVRAGAISAVRPLGPAAP